MAKSRKKTEVDETLEVDRGVPRNAGDERQRIASRAYELYLSRGRQDGRALDDWLEAEQELLELTGSRRER